MIFWEKRTETVARNILWRRALWIVRVLKKRKDAKKLLALDDRNLGDIGISRGAIDYYVTHGRTGKKI